MDGFISVCVIVERSVVYWRIESENLQCLVDAIKTSAEEVIRKVLLVYIKFGCK